MKWFAIGAAIIILAIPVIVLGELPVTDTAVNSNTESNDQPHKNSTSENSGFPVGLGYVAAALAVGLGSIGAGLAVGATASAAVGAVAEKEEIAGKALVFVGLAEGIAIYGLIIAIMILNRLH